MELTVNNIRRTEPDSHILYRLKYCGDVVNSKHSDTVEVFFVVELNPLGERTVYWDFGRAPEHLDEAEQSAILKILRDFADDDKLPR